MRTLRNRRPATANAAPISDIAFLLLIFFLVTTIFALEKGIPMILPPGDSPAKKVNRDRIVTVRTDAAGRVTLDGVAVTLAQLRLGVEQRLTVDEDLIVVIESHPDSDYGLMVDVLDELRLAKARRISLKEMTAN